MARHLTAENSAMVLIDYAIGFATMFRSQATADNVNNATALAKIARIYGLPLIVTNGPDDAPAGPLYPELTAALGDHTFIERYGEFDAFDREEFATAVQATGRRRLVMAGLMTEGCLLATVLTALDLGFEVFVVEDASAGETRGTHETAVQRMIQAGARPVTWLSLASEYQRSWSNEKTSAAFGELLSQHNPAFALHYAHENHLRPPSPTAL
ncbi:isochorismatase family protein [Actinopolymorpha sp. B9G3]|uniref:isochorismatase family protein n=1 Tax=Actinopolymorpha sp. B9G3 TaxID=3158970 RepID=UPI0032D9630B